MVFDLRIKQAEVAFADGRLDEAYELVKSDEILGHRQGKRLAGRLGRAFVVRGNEHLSDKRLDQAMSDCNRAEKLNGNAVDVAKLRKSICELIEQNRAYGSGRNAKLAQARDNIENGWVSVAENMLGDHQGDEAAEALLQDAAVKRDKTASAVSRIEKAIDRGDIETAVDIIDSAKLASARSGDAAEVVWTVRAKLTGQIECYLNDGRLDMAETLVRKLELLGDSAETVQWSRTMDLCRQSRRCIEGAEPAKALETLSRLKMILPKAKWIDKAMGDAKKFQEAASAIKAGPLGLVGFSGVFSAEKDIVADNNLTEDSSPTVRPEMAGYSEQRRMDKLIMQIDGIGSYLVVCGNRVTVGPISSSQRPDVGFVADPALPVMTIERSDGDYFASSDRDILLNDKAAREKLLVDGDKIGLSMRCRMKFRKPNVASGTAVLIPASAKLPRADLTAVVLADREILIGNDSTCHICSEQVEKRLALITRDGKICIGKKQLAMDESIEVNGLRIVLTNVGD